MPEKPVNPEPVNPELEKMLGMVKRVGGLYVGDLVSNLFRNQPPEQRDQFWQETAREFESFSERITGLREALNSANITKKANPEHIIGAMRLRFVFVEDQMARELLTDLLLARTSTSPGFMDYKMNVEEEAQAMAEELGSNKGLRREAMKSVDLNKVIGSVLTGDLKLIRQTQLEKK